MQGGDAWWRTKLIETDKIAKVPTQADTRISGTLEVSIVQRVFKSQDRSREGTLDGHPVLHKQVTTTLIQRPPGEKAHSS